MFSTVRLASGRWLSTGKTQGGVLPLRWKGDGFPGKEWALLSILDFVESTCADAHGFWEKGQMLVFS